VGWRTSPASFPLRQATPVGTRPARTDLAGGHAVSLQVFDVLGRKVATLVDEVKQPGTYTVKWDASHVTSGVYFYRLTAGLFVGTRKCVIAK
jgi:hypothetical protein